MTTSITNCLMVVFAVGVTGCEERGEVGDAMQALRQAQDRSPEVAKELRQNLVEKNREVAQLEEKLARAERGVTDEVLEEREALKAAVQRHQEQVTQEVKEALQAAQEHNAQAERAQTRLDATRAPNVEARVNTETTIHPGGSNVEMQPQRDELAVDTQQMVERADQQGQPDQKQ